MFCGNDKIGQAKIVSDSTPIPETDNMGREKFWEDLGRPDGKSE